MGTGAAAAGIVTWLPSLAIARGDKWTLWAVISVDALVGIRSEDTAVGRALSGAVVSMLAASSLAVLGILPSEAHILNSARLSVSIYRIPSGSDPSDAAPARACSHGAAVHP